MKQKYLVIICMFFNMCYSNPKAIIMNAPRTIKMEKDQTSLRQFAAAAGSTRDLTGIRKRIHPRIKSTEEPTPLSATKSFRSKILPSTCPELACGSLFVLNELLSVSAELQDTASYNTPEDNFSGAPPLEVTFSCCFFFALWYWIDEQHYRRIDEQYYHR